GRWSIHSTWRDDKHMLRLNRGMPVVYVNPQDAEERGISDGDIVRVFNDFGDLKANARVYPNAPRGQITMYHGWEKYQFADRSNFQATVPIRIKPTQLAGGYGQLHFALNYWGPTGVNRDVRVDVEKSSQTASTEQPRTTDGTRVASAAGRTQAVTAKGA
ncbi:MAG: molybdopterin dinucleotide binding domain-containing protein, partial [Candidatus Bipolaricaulia bacterium]